MTTNPSLDNSSRAIEPVARLASISLDCADPSALADFYSALLGLERVFETPDGGVIGLSDGSTWLTMMRIEDHLAPTWPDQTRLKQMHLDLAVTDLDAGVAAAVALGATEADSQAAPRAWRVLIDPAGHPFCLSTVRPD